MTTTEILLIINSALLSFIGILFVIIGFFLKDFHRDFKELVQRVNQLNTEHQAHTGAFGLIRDHFEQQLEKLSKRIQRIESRKK